MATGKKIYIAKKEELQEHLNDFENPHNVTYKQIGAAPQYDYGTEELTPGASQLETGKIYLMYE